MAHPRRKIQTIMISLFGLLALFYSLRAGFSTQTRPPFNPNHGSPSTNGAVASLSDTCSRVGVDLMEADGNAADAVSTECTKIPNSFV